MPKRPSLPLVTLALPVTLALACAPAPERDDPKPEAKTDTEAKPEAKPETTTPPADPNPYAEFGMPAAGKWTNADFADAYKAINAIAKQDPALLPRVGDPTFAAMTDVEHLGLLAGAIAPEQLAGLSLSLGMIHMVYGDQARREPEFEREWLILTAAVLGVTSKLPATVVRTEADAEAVRGEPSRLKGVLRYRHGIHELVEKLSGFEPKSKLEYGFACTQLARVIDDAAPLLLSEERAAVRTQLEACAGAGAEAAAVEQLQRALAEDAPSAPLVTVLLAEHREFGASTAAPAPTPSPTP